MQHSYQSKRLLIAFSALITLPFLQACSSTPHGTSAQSIPGDKGSQINQISENYFEETLKLDPLFATSIGDHRFDDQLANPLTAEHRKQVQALVDNTLSSLQKLGCDHLAEQEQLTCEAMVDDLTAEKQLLKTDLSYLMPLNQFESFPFDFPDLAAGASYVGFDTKLDYENFLKRMHAIPDYFDTMIANMKTGMKKGVTTPKVLVKKALKQLHELSTTPEKESPFYKPLLSLEQKVSPADAADLKARYETAIHNEIYPAYERLEKFTREQYLPKARTTHGLGSLPGGRDYYKALVRYHTTTTRTPDEIMNLGLSEVKRIRGEFEMARAQMGFNGTLKQFFASIRNDPRIYPFHSSQEVLDAYQAIHQKEMAKIPSQFSLLPKAKFEIREIPKFKAATAAENYQNASADGSRPGIFWVPIPDPAKYTSKDMESLFLHEAIPGHHFQISIQQELQNLPRYRRFTGNNAYVEGWALYTEGLGKELGLYTDPIQWIGRLSNEVHRAIRLVVDTGIHWKGWTREKAIQYSMENEPSDERGTIAEIERYMAIPGQALSYKNGELKIRELKEKTKQVLGAKYDPRDFHTQILKDGALPLITLEKKFNRWLNVDQKGTQK